MMTVTGPVKFRHERGNAQDAISGDAVAKWKNGNGSGRINEDKVVYLSP
jgi:hypothetical protein